MIIIYLPWDWPDKKELRETKQNNLEKQRKAAHRDYNAGKFRKNKGQQKAPRTLGSWHLKLHGIKNQDPKAANYIMSFDQNILMWRRFNQSSFSSWAVPSQNSENSHPSCLGRPI